MDMVVLVQTIKWEVNNKFLMDSQYNKDIHQCNLMDRHHHTDSQWRQDKLLHTVFSHHHMDNRVTFLHQFHNMPNNQDNCTVNHQSMELLQKDNTVPQLTVSNEYSDR